jgi:hypothetical protein
LVSGSIPVRPAWLSRATRRHTILFWETINQIDNLHYLIIESAFSNAKQDIAMRSKHFCPALLIEEFKKLQRDVDIYITHLRQEDAEQTMREITAGVSGLHPKRLLCQQLFEF